MSDDLQDRLTQLRHRLAVWPLRADTAELSDIEAELIALGDELAETRGAGMTAGRDTLPPWLVTVSRGLCGAGPAAAALGLVLDLDAVIWSGLALALGGAALQWVDHRCARRAEHAHDRTARLGGQVNELCACVSALFLRLERRGA